MASSSSSCTFILVTGVILTLTCGSLTSLGLPPPTPSLPSYETKIACEGGHLRLECEEGTKINLIRANFGRFSISICNTQGNLEWSVNCMSRRSFRVIQEMCGNRSDCTLSASSVYFGDPCPGVHKYLEVHYQCLPESLKTSTSILSERRPSSSVMKTLPKVSSSNSQRTRGGGGSSSPTSLSSSSIDSFGVSSFSNNNNQTSVTEGVRSNNKSPSASSSSSSTSNQSTSPPSLSTKFLSSSSTPASSSVSVSPSSSSPSTLSSSSLSSTTSTTTSGPPLIPPSLFDPDSPSSVSISHSREGSSPSSSGGSGSSSSSSSESSNRFLLHDPVVDTRDFDFSPDPSLHPPPSSSSGTSTATGGVGIGSPGSPSMTDDDYEGTSSPLDSMSDVSSTSSSSFLPLSDNLRVLLTVGCVFGVICLFLTMLSLVMSTTHGGIGRGNFFLGGSSSSSASSSLPPSSSSSHHKGNRAAKLELQVKQNLTLCLLMVEVLFLIGINISQQQPTIGFFCGLVSASLHYFFLCIFIWLFFDGFTLYLALLKHHEEDDIMMNVHNHNHNSLHHQQPHQNNLNLNSSVSHHLPHHSSSSIISCASKRKPCRCYLIIAYGLPLIVQIVSSILDSSTLSSSESSSSSPFAHCWLRSDKYFVLTFVGPVIAVLSANFLFLAITVVCSNYGSLFALDRESSKQHYNTGSAVVVINGIATTTGGSSSTEHPLRLRLKTSLAVFVVMSLTLTALFVSLCQELPEDQVVFTSCLYVFAIFNPIQVIVLLILFSQSSSTVKNNSLRVLSSLGFLDAAKSPSSSSAGRFKGDATSPEVLPVQPIIPLPHASTLNLSSVGAGNGGADVDGREGSIHSKPYSSDYGFRGNLNATSAQHHLNNYRSPVYGSSSGAIATSSAIRGVRSGHIHTKQCLQYPCQYPHIVEHVYESIDEDPYIARLLLPIPTPLIGRKASANGHDSQQAQLSSSSHSVLPAIIRDNTNHSTIICSSALTPGVVSGGMTTTTGVVRASVNNKSHLVSNITTGGGMSSLQQNHQPQQLSADQQAAATAAKLRHESTLI